MAQKIIFNYTEMENTVHKIAELSENYRNAAASFKTAMNAAMDGWEGDSKTRFDGILTGSVYNYMEKSVPDMVTALSDLLKNNAQAMQDTDAEIAKNIPDSITG